ncbi:MAG TPA: ATP-binding protein [Candidatus Ozemobacteraceae bacterium]
MSEDRTCQLALRESEAKYRAFFETIRDAAVVIDLVTGRVLEANRQAVQLLGWSIEELQGKHYLDVMPQDQHETAERLFHLDPREQETRCFELVLCHRDNTRIPTKIATTVFDDGSQKGLIFGLIHDLRERKARESALQLEEARLEAVLKLNQMAETEFDKLAGFALEEAVRLTSSVYGFLALVSECGARATLYALSTSALRDCRMRVHPTQQNVPLEGVRAEAVRMRKPILWDSRTGAGTGGLHLPEGHVPISRLLNVPILDRDVVVLLVGVANKGTAYDDADIRQLTLLMSEMWSLYRRRKAEEEGRKLENQMKQVQKLESLGVLAGGIAHDFNNILTTIIGHVELAKISLPPRHEAQGHLEPVVVAARRAAGLCRQMLACAGKNHAEYGPCRLNVLIRDMMNLIEISVSKKAELDLHLDERLPEIDADSVQMRQVVLNVLNNASEALEDGLGKITIRTSSMVCDRRELAGISLGNELREGRYVILEVSDTGCGMDAATQERMFEPFFTTKFTGRGLGLAAVLGIIRCHRGAIRVSSVIGKGTTCRIYLPAKEPETGTTG